MSLQGVTRTVALALLWMGCSDSLPPQRQLLLYVDTDAPLPPAPGVQLADGEPPPLFDTLLVEVQPTDAAEPCDECTRTFSLDRDTVARVEASFGVPLPDGETPRIRLRLYDSGSTLTGAVPQPTVQVPTVQSVIDITVDADGMGQDGVIEAHVMLPVEQVGPPVGPEAAALSLGKPNSSQVGTWPYARRVDCAEPANPDEVCIAGGAFWMGNPRERGSGIGDAHNLRRLVCFRPSSSIAPRSRSPSTEPLPDTAPIRHRMGRCARRRKWRISPTPNNPARRTTCRSPAFQSQGRVPTASRRPLAYRGSVGVRRRCIESRLFVWGSDSPAATTRCFCAGSRRRRPASVRYRRPAHRCSPRAAPTWWARWWIRRGATGSISPAGRSSTSLEMRRSGFRTAGIARTSHAGRAAACTVISSAANRAPPTATRASSVEAAGSSGHDRPRQRIAEARFATSTSPTGRGSISVSAACAPPPRRLSDAISRRARR